MIKLAINPSYQSTSCRSTFTIRNYMTVVYNR